MNQEQLENLLRYRIESYLHSSGHLAGAQERPDGQG